MATRAWLYPTNIFVLLLLLLHLMSAHGEDTNNQAGNCQGENQIHIYSHCNHVTRCELILKLESRSIPQQMLQRVFFNQVL